MDDLGDTDSLIIVASHLEPIYRELEPPYMEICAVLSNGLVEGYQHYVEMYPSFEAHPESLSEIIILLGASQFFKDKKQVGLNHYRRIFSLNPQDPKDQNYTQDYRTRYATASLHADFLNDYVSNVVIPKPLEFNTSVYEHFITHHLPLEQALDVACLAFNESVRDVFGVIDSKSDLKNTQYLYPWNMWIGNPEFYNEWLTLLFPVLRALDDISDLLPSDGIQHRWSGFISERLFTVFIIHCRRANRWNFVERPVIFFEDSVVVERDTAIVERDTAIVERDAAIVERDAAELGFERLLRSKSWKSTRLLRVADQIMRNLYFSSRK